MSPFQLRLHLSRGLLALAVLALVAAHFFPVMDFFSPLYLADFWKGCWEVLHDVSARDNDWRGLVFVPLFIGGMLIFAALPFIVVPLSRSKGFRWTARLLMILPAGFLLLIHTIHPEGVDRTGMVIFINAFTLAALGTLVVPAARPDKQPDGRKPASRIVGILAIALVLAAFPWLVRWRRNITRTEECRKQLALFELTLRHYQAKTGHFPEGRQAMMVLAGKDEVIATQPDDRLPDLLGLFSPDPRDPWGRKYRYELNESGEVILSSDGADREPDTEDDIRRIIAPASP